MHYLHLLLNYDASFANTHYRAMALKVAVLFTVYSASYQGADNGLH